jgi:hypothetical protein
VRVVAKEDATVTPYEDLREEITKRLSQQRMASVYEEYVEGLRKASEKTTQTTVSEVSLTVPNVPGSTLSGPGSGPRPERRTRRLRRRPRRASRRARHRRLRDQHDAPGPSGARRAAALPDTNRPRPRPASPSPGA